MEQEIRDLQAARRAGQAPAPNARAVERFDHDVYGEVDETEYADHVVEVGEEDTLNPSGVALGDLRGEQIAQHILSEGVGDADDEDPREVLSRMREKNGIAARQTVAEREGAYRARARRRFEMSPERGGEKGRGYKDIMAERDREREDARREAEAAQAAEGAPPGGPPGAAPGGGRRRNRWDDTPRAEPPSGGAWEKDGPSAPRAWDATPVATGDASQWDATPLATPRRSRFDDTPAGGRKRSRWDETPVAGAPAALAAPAAPALSDAELDALLPGPAEGYAIVAPPPGHGAAAGGARPMLDTPTPGFTLPEGGAGAAAAGAAELSLPEDLPALRKGDAEHFGALAEDVEEGALDKKEAVRRRILRLLLKVKNGTPPQRKTALRQLTDRAGAFGAAALFEQILPILMSPSLEEQERHLMVKVVDRVLYKLGAQVRPFVHKILVVIEPLLIEEDHHARAEGREIISNLAKAAGLACMITEMRPDVDHVDEYVRNTTARALAVVAGALGIPAMLPFLRAVCASRRAWQARHTGLKVLQQVAILSGGAVLPHLPQLTTLAARGLEDGEQIVRTIAALALAALAEAAHPYGFESFEEHLEVLWRGIQRHRGKGLAAFLKAVGLVVPLMDDAYAAHYARGLKPVLLREFRSPDEEMRKIVLKVLRQCVLCGGVDGAFVREEILPEFVRCFWVRRMALDRRNLRQVVDTSVALADKAGAGALVPALVPVLKDESEPFRRMALEAIDGIVAAQGLLDLEERAEERLVDGVLFAFQEQSEGGGAPANDVHLRCFASVAVALGRRTRPYLPQICGTIKWRLNNHSAAVRMQAADLVARVAPVMRTCGEEQLLLYLGQILFEYLGEEYPEVLGSILGALRAVLRAVGAEKMTPPPSELLPRLTPVLRNRHEKVQRACVELVGDVAEGAAGAAGAREWMRICFELLELLKAQRRGIRRAAVGTFGHIARAIGPQDVLHALLSNLKVQERQMRVCTTVAIGVVAEACGPFTVLPALMSDYAVPDLNVQNGVLKALSFVFEYIGAAGKDYVYAVVPLLEDALIDRDAVHRQTAMACVKHMALGVRGSGKEDALAHLLNYVWPNVLEESPHVINACFEAVEALAVALGPRVLLRYVLQGLFHPARRVRDVYWKIYNTLYILQQDALVPSYPAVAGEPGRSYERTTLELFI